MDKITKAHYKYVKQNLESKDKDTQASIRRILKLRAKYIKEHKHANNLRSKGYISPIIYGLQLALSELGIDINRYGL